MVEDEECETLEAIRRALKNQKKLDMCAEGFEIGRMSKLVGSEAANYMGELEDLYDKMLCKIDALSKLVEQTSAKVVGQVRMRRKVGSWNKVSIFRLKLDAISLFKHWLNCFIFEFGLTFLAGES